MEGILIDLASLRVHRDIRHPGARLLGIINVELGQGFLGIAAALGKARCRLENIIAYVCRNITNA